MRRFVRALLWLYVFSVPWDTVTVPYVGSVSRLLGLIVLSVAMLATILKGSIRRPDAVTWAAMAFVGWSTLTLAWTIASTETTERVSFYLQVVGSVFVIREFIRTAEDVQPLLLAYCLGAFVPIVDLLNHYRLNQQISMKGRFSGAGLNADTLGTVVVIGIPIAWFLFLNRRRFSRAVALVYLSVAPLAVMLTGTRGAFLAGLVAVSIVPLTLPRLRVRSYVLVCAMLVAASTMAAMFAPPTSWTRMLSIPDELAGGGLTGRRSIWAAGMEVFWEHPFIGAGAGAYGAATQRLLNISNTAPHSLPIGLLVEEGVIGAGLFAVLLGACAVTIVQFPRAPRHLWSVVLLTWLAGAASANWESVKITWLLVSLIAAQGGIARYRRTSEVVDIAHGFSNRPIEALPANFGAVPLRRTEHHRARYS